MRGRAQGGEERNGRPRKSLIKRSLLSRTRTFNPLVAGSNPARPTKEISGLGCTGPLPFFGCSHFCTNRDDPGRRFREVFRRQVRVPAHHLHRFPAPSSWSSGTGLIHATRRGISICGRSRPATFAASAPGASAQGAPSKDSSPGQRGRPGLVGDVRDTQLAYIRNLRIILP